MLIVQSDLVTPVLPDYLPVGGSPTLALTRAGALTPDMQTACTPGVEWSAIVRPPAFSPLGRTNGHHIYQRDVHSCQTAYLANRPRAPCLLLRKACRRSPSVRCTFRR